MAKCRNRYCMNGAGGYDSTIMLTAHLCRDCAEEAEEREWDRINEEADAGWDHD